MASSSSSLPNSKSVSVRGGVWREGAANFALEGWPLPPFSTPLLTPSLLRGCQALPSMDAEDARVTDADKVAVDYDDPLTLQRFIMEELASTGVAVFMSSISLACKYIAMSVRKAGIAGLYGLDGATNTSGDEVKKLDMLSNDVFINALKHSKELAVMVMVSEENEVRAHHRRRIVRWQAHDCVRSAGRLVEYRLQCVHRHYLRDIQKGKQILNTLITGFNRKRGDDNNPVTKRGK